MAAVVCLLAACVSTVETVDHRLLLQPGTRTYQLDELELFMMPMELDSPLPVFPPKADGHPVAVEQVPGRLASSFEFHRNDGRAVVASRRLPD